MSCRYVMCQVYSLISLTVFVLKSSLDSYARDLQLVVHDLCISQWQASASELYALSCLLVVVSEYTS